MGMLGWSWEGWDGNIRIELGVPELVCWDGTGGAALGVLGWNRRCWAGAGRCSTEGSGVGVGSGVQKLDGGGVLRWGRSRAGVWEMEERGWAVLRVRSGGAMEQGWGTGRNGLMERGALSRGTGGSGGGGLGAQSGHDWEQTGRTSRDCEALGTGGWVWGLRACWAHCHNTLFLLSVKEAPREAGGELSLLLQDR